LKPREPRRKILITARMRSGSDWDDISLFNISSRGALAQAVLPPSQGTYVEIRRGPHLLLARVMWTDKHRFGVHTQDPIRIDDFISDLGGSGKAQEQVAATYAAERRATIRKPPSSDRHDRSRYLGKSLEFCFFVGACVAVTGVAFNAVRAALSEPLSQVTAKLAPK
jgi:hypothetical protein